MHGAIGGLVSLDSKGQRWHCLPWAIALCSVNVVLTMMTPNLAICLLWWIPVFCDVMSRVTWHHINLLVVFDSVQVHWSYQLSIHKQTSLICNQPLNTFTVRGINDREKTTPRRPKSINACWYGINYVLWFLQLPQYRHFVLLPLLHHRLHVRLVLQTIHWFHNKFSQSRRREGPY